jgi:hypothetical protein
LGRPRGSKNRKFAEIARMATEAGLAPIEVLLGAMRVAWRRAGEELDEERAASLRKEAVVCSMAAAPYCHPRLNAIEHSGAVGVSHQEALDLLDIESNPKVVH